MRMRPSLILGFALIASLTVAGSASAIVDTVAYGAGFAQQAADHPEQAPQMAQDAAAAAQAWAPGYATSTAYSLSGLAYGCSHLDARCPGSSEAGYAAAMAATVEGNLLFFKDSAEAIALGAANAVAADPAGAPTLVEQAARGQVDAKQAQLCAAGILAPPGVDVDLTYGDSEVDLGFTAETC
ncbi:MAG: hypothetical protein LC624_03820 [Halobacteriales archaeon]|nr:hypothetical protein [Halobacteriales archaeon]